MSVRRVHISAVQMKWSLAMYRDETAFAGRIRELMAAAEASRPNGVPHLVVFPEFIGLPLVFLDETERVQGCRTWAQAGRRLGLAHAWQVGSTLVRRRTSPIRALLLAMSPKVREVYLRVFSALAQEFHSHLLAGSAALPEFDSGKPAGSQVSNVCHFFGPDGALLATQKKVHPFEEEATPSGLHLAAGRLEDVRVIETEFGRVGIAVCYDAWQDDVMGRLEQQGPDIVVLPSANPGVWDAPQAADWQAGLWQRVQDSSVFRYGVNAMMVGHLFAPGDEISCQGRSSIIAVTEQTADGSGYLARASEQPWGEYLNEEIVSATVALPA